MTKQKTKNSALIGACADYADIRLDISDVCAKHHIEARDLLLAKKGAAKEEVEALQAARYARALSHIEKAGAYIRTADVTTRHGTAILGKAKALADFDMRWAAILAQDVFGDYLYQLKDQDKRIVALQKQLDEMSKKG